MNTTANRTAAFQPLLSSTARLASVIGVAAVIAVVWMSAEQSSRQAVQSATQSFLQAPVYATLPAVQIVGRRDAAGAQAARTGKAA